MPSTLQHAKQVPAHTLELGKHICPACKGPLSQKNEQLVSCNECLFRFPVREGQPDFRLDTQVQDSEPIEQDGTEKWQNRIKMQLRRYPGLYRFLVYTIGTALYLGPTSQQFVKSLGANASVLSIGAGVLRLKGNVTHLDYEPYPHLEVVGDAHFLPFPDNTFDGVVCETLLEHVVEPSKVIEEMHRVLKPGGKAYILMPFLFAFHAAPNDFYRMTHRGLAYQMRAFEIEKLAPFSGPASALNNLLVEWFALLFSMGSKKLYRIFSLVFLVVFCPVKLLDYVLAFHPEAVRIASILLCIGRKPNQGEAF